MELIELKKYLFNGEFANQVNEVVVGEKISDSDMIYNILKPIMSFHNDVEKFYVVYLNTQNHIISLNMEFEGSMGTCAVYPREIVKRIIQNKAHSIILAHNHPGGSLEPSTEDKTITMKIVIPCYTIGVSVLDHLIVTNSGFTSMGRDGAIGIMLKNYIEFQNNHF